MKTFEDARNATVQQLRGMTPPQVDELFAVAWDQRYAMVMSTFDVIEDLHYDLKDRRVSRRGWILSTSEAEDRARESTGEARRTLDKLNRIRGSIAELDDTVLARLGEEFDRRGGWPRAYLVTDGHVHSSRNCSSCNNGKFPTRFFWMIDYSGKTHAEIVEAAGERACTVCYPDAPVARRDKDSTVQVPESAMFTPEEIERAKAREEEAQRRAEKKAKAALGAITQPDGTPLRDNMGRDGKQSGSVVKTLRTARSELKRQCWYQHNWGDDDGAYERTIQHLARSVAWKENGLAIGDEPTAEQIEAVIKPLRDKAVKELDKSRSGR